jgi:hypothetical protein
MTGSAVQEVRERHEREGEPPFRDDLSAETILRLKGQRRAERELEIGAAERADDQRQATRQHEERQRKQAAAEQAAQRQWADRRGGLEAQLNTAREALAQLSGQARSETTDVEGAVAAAQARGAILGAEDLVAEAERALASHTRGRGRHGMFAA